MRNSFLVSRFKVLQIFMATLTLTKQFCFRIYPKLLISHEGKDSGACRSVEMGLLPSTGLG